MARNTSRKPAPDNDDPLRHDAEAIADAYRGRREEEPAAAPMETDQEASDERPIPRQQPPKTFLVNSDGEAERMEDRKPVTDREKEAAKERDIENPEGADVRAGPGDAGAQSAPRVLDNPRDKPAKNFRPLGIGIAAGLILLIIILFAF